jgi:two-component system sensor kinase FixL
MAEARSARREVPIRTGIDGDGGVEVEIGDSGPGIDDHVLGHVFDQFFTTKPDGVGMGLSISRSIVEAHGGRIRAEARGGGGGATFRFWLPAAATRTHDAARAHGFHR